MKNFKLIPAPLTIIVFLLIGLSSCNGQTQNNHPGNESGKQSSSAQLNGLSATVNVVDKNIRSIFQDRNGTYWFGTNGAGVYRYDTKTLTQFTVKDGLADNQVINIQEDNSGNIWFGTGGFGISKFDGKKVTTLTNNVNITKGTESDWKSKNNDLWFFAGGGALRYSNPSIDYLPFDKSGSNTQINAPFSLSRYGVYCILKDRNGNLWFGTQAEGVCRYDGKTLSWFKEKGLAGPAVLGLFEDSKGNLWFGNNGAGLFRYDGKTLTNITAEKGLNNADFRASGKPGSGTLARVYSINEDNNGNIWVGTIDAGVWKYDGSNLTNYTNKNGLTGNAVNTIYKDKTGELWFGTDGNGICKFNGNTFSEFIIK
ncbi:MAG: two-component regulator propeller domain-containing protein [Chitinophagaceae bacterium]